LKIHFSGNNLISNLHKICLAEQITHYDKNTEFTTNFYIKQAQNLIRTVWCAFPCGTNKVPNLFWVSK